MTLKHIDWMVNYKLESAFLSIHAYILTSSYETQKVHQTSVIDPIPAGLRIQVE